MSVEQSLNDLVTSTNNLIANIAASQSAVTANVSSAATSAAAAAVSSSAIAKTADLASPTGLASIGTTDGNAQLALTTVQQASRQGDGNYSNIFATPPVNDIPTITSSSSTVVGGSPLVPTTDFYYDPYFRYDGTYSGAITAITGGIRPSLVGGSSTLILPEIVTDAQQVEFEFLAGRTGTQGLHVRAVIDGKMCQMQMQRFPSTANSHVFFRLVFPTVAQRRIKLEQEGCVDFFGVRLSNYTIARRPIGEYRSTFVVIGDSLTQGGQNTGDVSGSLYFCRLESHSYFQSRLMGCDSYINLGVGGTGWSDVISTNKFGDRISGALLAKPSVLFFAGSRNDSGRESQIVAAVRSAMLQCTEVPVVLVSGPQQAGYTTLSELVRVATVESGRRFLNLDGVAASPASNPTGHPTYAECVALAKAAHAQTDTMLIQSRIDAAFYARPAPVITLTSNITPPIANGTPLTFTATVSSGFAGSIQFYLNGVESGSPVAISNGTSTLTITLSSGTTSVQARYLPTDYRINRSAVSTILMVQVNTNTGFTDNFNRADGPVGNTVNGKAWVAALGDLSTFTITSNQLTRATATASRPLIVDTGLANGTLQFTMQGTYNKTAGLIFRWIDGANYWRFDYTAATDAPVLTKVVAGVGTVVATGAAGNWTAGDILSVVMNEGSITAKKNGTTVVSATGQTDLIGATSVGIWTTTLTTAVAFDDASFV